MKTTLIALLLAITVTVQGQITTPATKEVKTLVSAEWALIQEVSTFSDVVKTDSVVYVYNQFPEKIIGNRGYTNNGDTIIRWMREYKVEQMLSGKLKYYQYCQKFVMKPTEKTNDEKMYDLLVTAKEEGLTSTDLVKDATFTSIAFPVKPVVVDSVQNTLITPIEITK